VPVSISKAALATRASAALMEANFVMMARALRALSSTIDMMPALGFGAAGNTMRRKTILRYV
jgi:hypothetical protein